MKCTHTNGLQTRYFVAGHGPDVLFLHGWAASGRMWLRSLFALRREFRAWAIDLGGFGDSDNPVESGYTLELYSDQVAGFCAEMGIQPAVVVGHSIGGRVALDLALRYPHLAQSVVAVSPTITGRLGFGLDTLLLGRAGEALLSLSQHFWLLAETGVMWQFITPRFLNSESVKRASSDLRRASVDALSGSLRAVLGRDFSPNLPHIAQPTLIICGERDFTVPPDDARMAADLIPNAELVMLEDVHHMPSDEAADEFHDLIRAFAQRKLNGRQ
jgi:pimeloyl-ACP methyl ester carboxylesterase